MSKAEHNGYCHSSSLRTGFEKTTQIRGMESAPSSAYYLIPAGKRPGFSVSSRFLSLQGSKDLAHFVPLPSSPLALLPRVRMAVQPAKSMIAVLHLSVETRIQQNPAESNRTQQNPIEPNGIQHIRPNFIYYLLTSWSQNRCHLGCH